MYLGDFRMFVTHKDVDLSMYKLNDLGRCKADQLSLEIAGWNLESLLQIGRRKHWHLS